PAWGARCWRRPCPTRTTRRPRRRRPRRPGRTAGRNCPRLTGGCDHERSRTMVIDRDGVCTGDCLRVLPEIAGRPFRLVLTDPPWNNATRYQGGRPDRLPVPLYLAQIRLAFAYCRQVLRPDGRLVTAVNTRHQGAFQVMRSELGFTWRNTPAWCYRFGNCFQDRWGYDHTPLLCFAMHPKRSQFHADAVRVRSVRLDIKDKRAVPGDVWAFGRLPGNDRRRRGHATQMRDEVVERLIRAYTQEGDWVLDPYCGSGSTLVGAAKLQRHWVGIEIVPEVADLARRAVADVTPDDRGGWRPPLIKRRPAGTPERPKPPPRLKPPPPPYDKFEEITAACGHRIQFGLWEPESKRDTFRAARRAKHQGRPCPACREARQRREMEEARQRREERKRAA